MSEIPSNRPAVVSCSGAADVGAVADGAARRLARDGHAKMLCLAAIGARLPSTMEAAQAAPSLLAINGCPSRCAAKMLEDAGFSGFADLQLAEMGFKKGQTPPSAETVAAVAAKGTALL
ncbi:putative zinc-binding protein [Oleispirillum naphthae]|uniref:putative zinc-binding protein n=1 Tax=Oleispirillum naphthae TaxID=2838853 RepID=UPI0030822D63